MAKQVLEAKLRRYEAGTRAARMYDENLPLILEIIAFVSRRCRFSPEDAKDFAQEVHRKLLEDDCRVLRECTGASLRNYLKVVIQRLSQDFRNHLWGKHRDSTEAKRLGGAALRIEQLTTRDELTPEEARLYLKFNEKIELSDAEFDLVRVRLPPKMRRQFLAVEHLSHVPAPSRNPAETLEAKEAEIWRREVLAQLRRCVKALSTQEQLLIHLIYAEGLKISDIAPIMGVPQKRLYPLRDKALAALRRCLEGAGIGWSEVLEVFHLLSDPAGPDGPDEPEEE